ncbi:hypothetical protein L207DRAFT_535962 [Hyaloscypha variabilis F]|uniref:Uncharacterized protein n=1 Tax=Hyaloscypha variabilis (strain UAMH 11265 / GT02V1 / F) TaxID=1149755 RepID=A0A2J6R2F4_HYAVF|nr:hypothetical protein L207DRAFT_535962 [Hyaloscypha variabilis F]
MDPIIQEATALALRNSPMSLALDVCSLRDRERFFMQENYMLRNNIACMEQQEIRSFERNEARDLQDYAESYQQELYDELFEARQRIEELQQQNTTKDAEIARVQQQHTQEEQAHQQTREQLAAAQQAQKEPEQRLAAERETIDELAWPMHNYPARERHRRRSRTMSPAANQASQHLRRRRRVESRGRRA